MPRFPPAGAKRPESMLTRVTVCQQETGSEGLTRADNVDQVEDPGQDRKGQHPREQDDSLDVVCFHVSPVLRISRWGDV